MIFNIKKGTLIVCVNTDSSQLADNRILFVSLSVSNYWTFDWWVQQIWDQSCKWGQDRSTSCPIVMVSVCPKLWIIHNQSLADHPARKRDDVKVGGPHVSYLSAHSSYLGFIHASFCYDVSQRTSGQVLHHHPQLVTHQVTVQISIYAGIYIYDIGRQEMFF